MNHINFNDEILEIEELKEHDNIDIEVSDDHLFYANGILTKNSIGVPMTADFIAAIIRDDDLEEQNEIWIKLLKNRYSSINNKKFNLGTNIETQSFFDVNQDAASDFNIDEITQQDETNKSRKFSNFNY